MTEKDLTREDYKEIGLSESQINAIIEKKASKDKREYKWIIKMTTKEALDASKIIGKEFIRATEWKGRKKR